MRIIKDIVRKLKKNEKIEKRSKDIELLKTVNGIWGALNLNEKLYILERSGYKLED